MTIALALASSLLWGVADFCGGRASRQRSALFVVLMSQSAGLAVALAVAAATGALAGPIGYLPWAIGAGLAGASAVVLFYRALAIGTMGIVAPIAAVGVVVPVVIGIIGGVLPSRLCLTGIAIAVVGVMVAARPGEASGRPRQHGRSVILALAAALGFGLLEYTISGGSQYSTLMTIVGMRATSVPLLAALALLIGRSGFWRPRLRTLLVIVVIGVLDVSANLLFGLATASGELAVVAVLGSLYPAVTVLLARVVDEERMSRVQDLGVAAAVIGVSMIAAGS